MRSTQLLVAAKSSSRLCNRCFGPLSQILGQPDVQVCPLSVAFFLALPPRQVKSRRQTRHPMATRKLVISVLGLL